MRLKDVIELIKVDMPDYTDGAFEVGIAADGAGNHIQISIEDHSNSHKILKTFIDRFKEHRVVVLKVPLGYLHLDEKK